MTFPRGMYNPCFQSTYVHTIKETLEDWQLEYNFCINGEWMSLEQFVKRIYPTDCAERTHLILKLTEQPNED